MATKKKTTVETDKPAKTVKAVKATAKTTAAKAAAPAKAVKEAKASKAAACNKALKEAAELAPLVQSAKDGTGENTSVEDAQKAAEFLMNNYEKSSEEKIIVDGIVIPTQAELLNMPESDYMNERQQAFFKHLLREREAQLRSNAGATAEHLRDNTIIPDMADRATIEEEHALELRTRDREREAAEEGPGSPPAPGKGRLRLVRRDRRPYRYSPSVGPSYRNALSGSSAETRTSPEAVR